MATVTVGVPVSSRASTRRAWLGCTLVASVATTTKAIRRGGLARGADIFVAGFRWHAQVGDAG